jgi:hypothetical protein
LKLFFNSNEGKAWLKELNVYPPYLSKSFIDYASSDGLVGEIRTNIGKDVANASEITLVAEENGLSNLVKSLR